MKPTRSPSPEALRTQVDISAIRGRIFASIANIEREAEALSPEKKRKKRDKDVRNARRTPTSETSRICARVPDGTDKYTSQKRGLIHEPRRNIPRASSPFKPESREGPATSSPIKEPTITLEGSLIEAPVKEADVDKSTVMVELEPVDEPATIIESSVLSKQYFDWN